MCHHVTTGAKRARGGEPAAWKPAHICRAYSHVRQTNTGSSDRAAQGRAPLKKCSKPKLGPSRGFSRHSKNPDGPSRHLFTQRGTQFAAPHSPAPRRPAPTQTEGKLHFTLILGPCRPPAGLCITFGQMTGSYQSVSTANMLRCSWPWQITDCPIMKKVAIRIVGMCLPITEGFKEKKKTHISCFFLSVCASKPIK